MSVGQVWTQVAYISQLLKDYPDETREVIEDSAREIPELAQYIRGMETNPILNYHPFDTDRGKMPWGDDKSSPIGFHQDPSKQRNIVTGNRCSKTHSGTAEVICGCIGMDPVTKGASERFKPPINVWAVSETEDASVEILQRKYHELVPMEMVHESCEYNERTGWKNNVIQFKEPFGSLIRFRFASQGRGTFQGTKQDIVHIDEEQPNDIDDECVARTAGVGGPPGEIIRTLTPIYNPRIGVSWIHAKLYSRRAEIPDLSFHFWSLIDVPEWIIPQEEKTRIIESYDEENRETRVHGAFTPAGVRLGFAMGLIKEQRKNQMAGKKGVLHRHEEWVEQGDTKVKNIKVLMKELAA